MQNLNLLLSLGGVATLFAVGILLADLFTSRVFAKLISVWGMTISFIVATASVVMTLVYSDVFGFVPCSLCWLQRVFLYPQVFLLATSIFYKEKIAARYGILLSVPGMIIALYQHYLQMGGSAFVACPVSGGDCAKRFLFEFGFMTFPLLSAILFLFLIVIYIYILKTENK